MSITLTGQQLTVAAIEALGRRADFTIDADAAAGVDRAAQAAQAVASVRPVYGRTSGVGANRDRTTASPRPGRALLRSHSAGWGEPFPGLTVRSALAIRVNQLLTGASGASGALLHALVDTVRPMTGSCPSSTGEEPSARVTSRPWRRWV